MRFERATERSAAPSSLGHQSRPVIRGERSWSASPLNLNAVLSSRPLHFTDADARSMITAD
jgi:hypothetical protein